MIKKRLVFFIFLFLFLGNKTFSQGIRDSVFQLKEFIKMDEHIFIKEEAGMKESKIDTLALMSKITGNLSDLLEQNTTIYIKSYGRGALSTASFRGTAATHTKVTWNGMPINSPMLGMVDFSIIPVFVLDGADIQYGSASISSNGGALGGNINLYNKPDWDNTFSSRVLAGYGSFSTYSALEQINAGNKWIQSKIRIYKNYSKNDYEIINTSIIGHPVTKNADADYQKYGALQEVYLRFADKWTGSAKIWYQDGVRSVPVVMSYEGSDSTQRKNRQTDITLKAVANVNYYGKKLKTEFQSGFDYQQLDYIMSIDVGGLGTQKPVNSGSNMHSWYNHAEASYEVNKKVSLKSSVDINYFDITSLDSANQTGYDKKRVEYSAFIGAYYHPITPINISVELRKDKVPITSTPFIYNVGLSYKPFQNIGLVWKNSVSRNFHSPSLNDLYWVPGGNPNLVPEEGHTAENGIQYALNTGKASLDIQLTGYYSDINNWILWLPSIKGYWEAMNLKRVISKGLEINVKAGQNIEKFQFRLQCNYAYTSTTNQGEPLNNMDASLGMQLPFIPEHSFNALAYVGYNNTFISFQHQYYGVRNLLSSNMATLEDDSGDNSTVPFYRLYAVPLQYVRIGHKQHIKNYVLSGELKISNLFDETYRSILNRFMPGRYYELLISVNF